MAKASDADELGKAVEAYTRATQLDLGPADAYRELALTYIRRGESGQALEAAEAYIKLRGGTGALDIPSLRALRPRELSAAEPIKRPRP